MVVPLAVMPEGVEHVYGAGVDAPRSTVPLAVMPEGVEHRPDSSRSSSPGVPLAVMPEGVEHTCKTS